MKKRFLSSLLAFCMVTLLLPIGVFSTDIIAQGVCGVNYDNVTWTLDSSGSLTIQGSGEMLGFFNANNICFDSSKVTSITIDFGVTNISGGAFSNCVNLESVSIPASAKSIGSYAFENCCNLESISIPNSVARIGDAAFRNCIKLSTLSLPEGVEYLGWRAFGECPNLKSISIPSSMKEIDHEAFWGCDSLAEVHISNLTKWCEISFGADANPLLLAHNLYLNGKLITNLVIPTDVAKIGATAFAGCDCLESVTIPSNVTSMGNGVFRECTGLKQAIIMDGISNLGESVFSGCINLQEIALPKSLTKIDYDTFYGCKSLRNVTIPIGVTSIESISFYDCRSLSSLTIPETVTEIGRYAFFGCSNLNNIYIPKSVTRIHEFAFRECKGLKDVYYGGSEKEFKLAVDDNNNELIYADHIHYNVLPDQAYPFTDVKTGAYYFDAVLWAVNHTPQITNGTSVSTFSPEATCTRGQVVTFLWRAMGCPEPTSSNNPFVDVKPSNYFYKAVLWAAEKNITNGIDASHFNPGGDCTRAHVVTFLWRAHEKPAASGSAPFVDVPAGQYYTDAVLWAVSQGITNGIDAAHFGPDRPCQRGQIVTFLYRDLK